ncbi:MAG TPA: hypothetical protein DCZ23_02045, partial [Lachnospiraceae bacterium]|nr:hypothetical protein [Lachnospiraceae bacterium]
DDTPEPDKTSKPADTSEPDETPAPAKTPAPPRLPVQTRTSEPEKRPVLIKTPTKAPAPMETPELVKTPEPAKTPAPTSTPVPDKEVKIFTDGNEITIGESVTQLKNDFGEPARIDKTGYNYDYYIYNSDYSKFAMVAVTDGEVSGVYTDATDFSYETLNASSEIEDVNLLFDKSYSLTKTLSLNSDGYAYTICFDTLGTQKITGIQVLKTSAAKKTGNPSGTQELENLSLEVWDLTNSIRARNGIATLEWSDTAAGTAKAHSADMAAKNYFDHTNLEGLSPFDRMENAGIKYYTAAENIIAGQSTSIGAANGWFNSAGHRKNMLEDSLTYLGVGFAYNTDSIYRYYGTQNFYS